MRVAKVPIIGSAEVMIDLESIELILYGPTGLATVRTKSGEDIDLKKDQAELLEQAWVRHLDGPPKPILDGGKH